MIAPFYAFTRQRQAVHAVTNERILTAYGRPFSATDSHAASKLSFVHRQDLRNGCGSLRIGYGTESDSDGDRRALEVTWTAIKHVRRAEMAVLELMRRAKP